MNILVDSCCDLSPELLKRTKAVVAPLTVTIDGTDYVDDGTVEIGPYLEAMRASRTPARSACPSPALYTEQMLSGDGGCFVITLSSKLSGSHNAAVLGREHALEEAPGRRIHIFDSESASAGETYLALMLRDLIDAGKSFEEIISAVENKIRSLHTLFVLDSLDNLVKNGRVSKTVGLLANVLSIRLVMSDDGSGAIRQLAKVRGIRGALAQMVETCRVHTEGMVAGSQRLVLSYCNCLDRAQQVYQLIREKCPAIGEIVMTPTSALSSMYAYDGGVIIAY